MWKRERTERVDLEDVLTTDAPPVPSTDVRPPTQPAASVAVPAATPVSPPAPRGSVLGVTLRFKAELVADEDLLVEGQVEGSILHTRTLTIGGQGRVQGDIRARRVIVEGTVDGNLHALESVTVRPGATVKGDVFARKVAIEQGATMCGRIDMDNAPVVPRIKAPGGQADTAPRELTDREVVELLASS